MKGLKKIEFVEDLISYLERCPPRAKILLMSEDDDDGFPIGGVLQFAGPKGGPEEVWILIDKYPNRDDGPTMEWINVGNSCDIDASGAGIDDYPVERPGDMACTLQAEEVKKDVIKVRGRLKTA